MLLSLIVRILYLLRTHFQVRTGNRISAVVPSLFGRWYSKALDGKPYNHPRRWFDLVRSALSLRARRLSTNRNIVLAVAEHEGKSLCVGLCNRSINFIFNLLFIHYLIKLISVFFLSLYLNNERSCFIQSIGAIDPSSKREMKFDSRNVSSCEFKERNNKTKRTTYLEIETNDRTSGAEGIQWSICLQRRQNVLCIIGLSARSASHFVCA